jgi:O-antigen/teichoic acid export membrane protein
MSATASPPVDVGARRLVARNTIIMMAAQALGVPLAVVVNAVMARTVGPGDYGIFYVLTTFASLAFMIVDWGQNGILPARIATDRPNASRYLGSALAWKCVASIAATGILAVVLQLQDQDLPLVPLALVCLGQALTLTARTCADVVRGFERVKVAAYTQVGGQFLLALFTIPVLYAFGTLNSYLIAAAAAGAIVLYAVWRGLHTVGIKALHADLATVKALLKDGNSFLVLNLILLLQPAIDAHYMALLASKEAIGWHAAAVKLMGPLLLPASALIGALYPTLCRLWTENVHEYMHTSRGALRAAFVMTMPIALGCGLFPDIGVRIFGTDTFGPAENNLRILALYVFLLYVTMTLGTCLNAAGRQRAWTVVQFTCIVIVLIADPLLVRWFQTHTGNGALGVNITTAGTELLMMIAGVWLMPRGVFDRSILRSGLLTLAAGAAMAGVAWLLKDYDSLWVAPLALGVYAATLFAIGGVDREQLQILTRGAAIRRAAKR